ncbi:Carbohydrate kinase FGGY family protein [Trichostrongylus colubriformis]|uniref:Carbohydrate kinase FGGY family protein n=1 Tax=Trichostrongylus colubriformis TaxID=6319 RepID=A0AAN8FNY3_TRICO
MSYTVGIDLGTTTVKVCVVEGTRIVKEDQVRHESNIHQRLGVQNAKKIIEVAVKLLEKTILEVTNNPVEDVLRIGISGQQHGIVLWNTEALRKGALDCSELYNWMYPGDIKAAAKLPRSSSNCVFPGYGMRTLCELASYDDFDKNHHWDRCGNIMDCFACYLTGSKGVLMSESNAYCWGYSTGLQWNSEILPFTPKWIELPQIVRTDVGAFTKLDDCRLVSLNGIPVGVAIADLHGSILSVRGRYEGADHAYLIIGTSSQLCFVVSNSIALPVMPITTHIFPFTDGLTLLAAASMNGGNTLDAFIASIQRWSEEATDAKSTSSANISRILSELDKASSQLNNSQDDVPKITPLFTAERGSQDTGVEICGLKSNTTLIQMLIGICDGVVRNLFSLVPPELLTSYGVKKLFLVGSAKKDRFLVHIQRYLQEHHCSNKIELVQATTETSAAYGVAI